MKILAIRKAPDCDVCTLLRLTQVNKSTADSVVNFKSLGHSRNCWGYTCDDHNNLRLGPVTILVERS